MQGALWGGSLKAFKAMAAIPGAGGKLGG
jgi:hypothetical protein